MLSKLLKYDFKSIKRVGLPAVIAMAVLILLAGIGGFSFVRLTSNLLESENETAFAFTSIGGVFLLIALITVIYAAIIGIFVVIMVDFYKFTATDEAYLTFTLPVKPHQIILSKLINAYGWILVIIILAIAVVFSMIFGIFLGDVGVSGTEFDDIAEDTVEVAVEVLDAAQVFGNLLNVVLTIIYLFVSLAHGILMYFLAIFLGSVIAKKHKILASVGCIFGISALNGAVMSIGQAILYVATMGVLFATEDILLYQNIVMGGQIVYYVGMTVLYFFVLKNLMKKKLNLP